jgi:hypothetical protein
MKTQILRLDPHDDVISTRDKMNWGQTGRVLLVWPKRGRLLRRRVDLVLLQRHSSSLGAQLALITGDPVVRFNAYQLAIPVFKSLRQAQSAHWRVERRRRVRPTPPARTPQPKSLEELEELRQAAHPPVQGWLVQPAARIGFFTLSVLAVLALAAILLPGAQVNLTPQTKTQTLTVTVRASPTQENVNLSGIVPARAVTVIVEGRDLLKVSGVTKNPDRTASGKVVFTNLSDQPVNIPLGLVVRDLADPPVRFTTIQTSELDAGPGITTTLAVRALNPGEAGNLPAGALTAIEGSLGLSLAATNTHPTLGGSDRDLPLPTSQDRQRLYEKLETALRQSARTELETQLTQGDLIFTQTLTITRMLEQSYTPADDQPSGQLELSLRLEYQAMSAARNDIDNLATVLLDANLPAGYAPLPDTLAVKQVTPVVIESANHARWQFTAQRLLSPVIPSSQAITLILGAPPAQAVKRLSDTWPLAEDPVIRLAPPWWPRLPSLPFRISINAQPGR